MLFPFFYLERYWPSLSFVMNCLAVLFVMNCFVVIKNSVACIVHSNHGKSTHQRQAVIKILIRPLLRFSCPLQLLSDAETARDFCPSREVLVNEYSQNSSIYPFITRGAWPVDQNGISDSGLQGRFLLPNADQ